MEKLRSIVLLIITFFSFGFLIIAPTELYNVYTVSSWDETEAEVVSSNVVTAGFRNDSAALEVIVKDIGTGQTIKIQDEAPGDLPFHVNLGPIRKPFWTSLSDVALKYEAGNIIKVIRSPKGDKYYLDRGSYKTFIIIFVVALSWFAILFVISKKSSKPS